MNGLKVYRIAGDPNGLTSAQAEHVQEVVRAAEHRAFKAGVEAAKLALKAEADKRLMAGTFGASELAFAYLFLCLAEQSGSLDMTQ